jgi:DNA-binding IscR family transcriptional regulator
MGKVFHAVEGDGLFGAHPRRPMASCPVGRRIETVLEDVNRRAQAAVEKELNSISLADVVASCQG